VEEKAMSIHTFIQQEHFHHHFQPIFSVNNRSIFGYEVLLRSDAYSNPECAFKEAKQESKLYDLEVRSIEKAVSSFSKTAWLSNNVKIFINVFPSTILKQSFQSFIEKVIREYALYDQQVILELNEAEEVIDLKEIVDAVNGLKDLGVLIALDDIGKGMSEIRSIIEIKPEFIKLDRYFIEGLLHSQEKQFMLITLLGYCEKFKSNLIAEGIEAEDELGFLKQLGVRFAQGYALGKPDVLK
jgi:EAL domain-containing protein (putative c-di-GMP-specific phosphodiesterase class I)